MVFGLGAYAVTMVSNAHRDRRHVVRGDSILPVDWLGGSGGARLVALVSRGLREAGLAAAMVGMLIPLWLLAVLIAALLWTDTAL